MKQLLIEHTALIGVEKPALIESIQKNDGRLIIRNVLLQRADSPNRNKRVYPKHILEREIRLYENKIKERRAFGELDHPECEFYLAEILTESGWKLLKDVEVGEKIPTLNTKTGALEMQPVKRVVNEPYKGKMIHIKGRNIDMVVTPNHRFNLLDRNNEFVEKTAQEIYDISKINKNSHLRIPITAEKWIGDFSDKYYIIPGVDIDITNKNWISKYLSPLTLDSKSFFGFLGFYLAEGHITDIDSTKGYGIFISQNKGEKADKFLNLISGLSSELEWTITERKNGKGLIFKCSDARLWTYLSKLGDKYTKHIPKDVKNASSELLQEFVDWYLLGDETKPVYKGYERKSIFSVSKKMIEDFNEILLKLGITGVIKEQTPKDRLIEGRLIEAKNSKTLYRLCFKSSKAIHLDFRFICIEEVDYDNTVHCVTVDNGSFYTRYNGLPHWTGNSNIVNLKNVCHAIVDVNWKGNEVYGDVEILPTPSGNIVRNILLAGFRVGQSSRGLGSVEPLREGGDSEVVEVQDDFELVTLSDCVSDESTIGANMVAPGLHESYSPKISTRYRNANLIMQEILCELGQQCCLDKPGKI